MVAGGGRLVAVACDHGDAAEIYELDPDSPGEARRITRDGARWFAPFHHATDATRSAFRDARVRDVQGWLTTSDRPARGARRPLVLHVHGGPSGARDPRRCSKI